MTRFEYYTKNPRRLEELISLVVDDALKAKGCSMYLSMPPETEDGRGQTWEDWLNGEFDE